ncbi:MAG: hypothetical protein ACOYK8_00445 [Alphaproteobacteria bacterium]
MERVKDILNEHMRILDNYPAMPAVGVVGVGLVCRRRMKGSHILNILTR